MPGPIFCRLKEADIDQIVKIIRDRDNYSEPENIRAKQIEIPKGIVEGGRFIGSTHFPMIENLKSNKLVAHLKLLLNEGKPFVTMDGEKLVLWKMIKEHIEAPEHKKKEPADISKIEDDIIRKKSKIVRQRRKFWLDSEHFPKKTQSKEPDPSFPTTEGIAIDAPVEIQEKEVVDVPETLTVAISEKRALVPDGQYPLLPEKVVKKQGIVAKREEDAHKIVNGIFKKAEIIGYKKILISEVRPFDGQSRKYFSLFALAKLAANIKAGGQRVLVIVMPIDDQVYKWELVDGESRYRAIKMAKKTHIHACIVAPMEKREQHLYSALANFGREDPIEIDQAHSLQRIKDDFGLTDVQLSHIIPKDNMWIGRRLSLLRLHPDVQAMLHPERKNGNSISISVANFLTKIKVQDEQLRMASTIAEKKMNLFEARNFIRKEINSKNLPVRTRKRSPADDYVIFKGLIERIGRDAGVYLEMKEGQFREMLARRYSTELDVLVQKMEGAISILTNLKQIIRPPAR